MDTSQTSLFQMASRRLAWLSARQQVISENVANADTPGYIGRDVQSFEDFLKDARVGADAPAVEEAATLWGGSKDGNTVVLEEQTILAAQVGGQFRLAARLYGKGHELIALAAGRR